LIAGLLVIAGLALIFVAAKLWDVYQDMKRLEQELLELRRILQKEVVRKRLI
jgi:hypothetical protein